MRDALCSISITLKRIMVYVKKYNSQYYIWIDRYVGDDSLYRLLGRCIGDTVHRNCDGLDQSEKSAFNRVPRSTGWNGYFGNYFLLFHGVHLYLLT